MKMHNESLLFETFREWIYSILGNSRNIKGSHSLVEKFSIEMSNELLKWYNHKTTGFHWKR